MKRTTTTTGEPLDENEDGDKMTLMVRKCDGFLGSSPPPYKVGTRVEDLLAPLHCTKRGPFQLGLLFQCDSGDVRRTETERERGKEGPGTTRKNTNAKLSLPPWTSKAGMGKHTITRQIQHWG